MKNDFCTLIIALAIIGCGARLASAAEPLPVYILAGQSNMQGHASVTTLPHVGMDPATAPLLAEMVDENGTPRIHPNVWISSIGNTGNEDEIHGPLTIGFGAGNSKDKLGPEWTFGIHMQKHVGRPILIIKTAWGGKSLHTDFRSPGSGVYEFRPDEIARLKSQNKDVEAEAQQRAAQSGEYYRLMMQHVDKVLADIDRVVPQYDAEAGYEIAGFVWFQGWNDMVDQGVYPNRSQPGGYDRYSLMMAQFIRDVRNDLDSPELPFVIGVFGVGGPVDDYGPSQQRYVSTHQGFRNAMAAPTSMTEFQGNVAAVLTENYWDVELAELKARGHRKTAQQREQLFTPRELEILQGSSNAEYHYNGSAKIMAQIGKGFADAVANLSMNKK